MNEPSVTYPVEIIIAAGDHLASAVDAAVTPWLALPPLSTAHEITIAVPDAGLARDPGAAPQRLATIFKHGERSVRIVAPPRRTIGAFLSARQADHWQSVRVSASAEWLDHASITASLATTSSLIFANTFTSQYHAPSPVIGAWVTFAHPRQRLAAAATGQREGIAAEIASAFHPDLMLLTNGDAGVPLAITTTDQIGAELVARAVQTIRATPKDDEEITGPWEDPLIQRATELALGVTWPGALAIHAIWAGRGDSAPAAFLDLVEQIRVRLGISAPIRIRATNP